ncbi:MAG TPA: alanine racemase [Candidatus Limnocylindrales bacterium]|nr:alanine racemase [Candidatus Limnocylindrales bacterium]
MRIEDRLAAVGLPALPRPAWLEIDTQALAGNLRAVADLAGPDARVAAVVKADGYGHGLEVTARTFAAAGADLLAVATLDEALALRRAGIDSRLLVLFAVPPEQAPRAMAAGIELVAADEPGLERTLSASAPRGEAAGRPGGAGGAGGAAGAGGGLVLHLEIETGLARGGIRPERAAAAAGRIRAAGARLAGTWSHLARAEDAEASAEQVGRLEQALDAIRAVGIDPGERHLAASGGLFAASAPAWERVRPGLALYGELADGLPVAPAALAAQARLRPAMTLKARALRIERLASGEPVGYGGLWRAPRPSLVATLPIGYGDGWPRASSPGAVALVRGRRVPLVGSVAMDAVIADVTDVPGVHADDEFVLLGAQGDDRITATELARLRTTISWEVLATMAYRVPRVYHGRPGPTGLRTLEGETLAPRDAPGHHD